MGTDELRAGLAQLHLSQAAFARIIHHLAGSTAQPVIALRRVEKWAQGLHPVSDEAAALLNLWLRWPGTLELVQAALAAGGTAQQRPVAAPAPERR